MMKKVKTLLTLLIMILLFLNTESNAQCAMCKAVVESNMEAGSNIGKGLNAGILYLMSIPYLSIFFFGALWYFQNKKAK